MKRDEISITNLDMRIKRTVPISRLIACKYLMKKYRRLFSVNDKVVSEVARQLLEMVLQACGKPSMISVSSSYLFPRNSFKNSCWLKGD